MDIAEIVASLDREIAFLEQARALLSGASTAGRGGRGRRAGAPAAAKKGKRNLSPEGRRRIAEAVKRRWDRQRKAAAAQKEASAKKAATAQKEAPAKKAAAAKK